MSLALKTESVRIVEVGPRDGLQNIGTIVPTLTKIDFINRLRGAGLGTIELTSIVSPRAIPQLSDCGTLLSDAGIKKLIRDTSLRTPVLIPNLKGLDVAIKQNVREIAVFVSASEGFSRANIQCSVQQGLDRAREVAESARNHGIAVRG
jgi:hydroxymethylglutaryl-CoA lyase